MPTEHGNAPSVRFPPGSTVRIDGVSHTFMLVEDAGYVLRSEMDGRMNTLDFYQIIALYFAGKLEIPRQVRPGCRQASGTTSDGR